MKRPIGVIDSGVGGLTVAKEIMLLLPEENIIYLGDNARCPYGSRTEQEIVEFTSEIVNYLLLQNIKALVIACNTITAYALQILQKKLSIPVLGVIRPGARTAIGETRTKHIGVIGTEATIRSKAYENELLVMDAHVKSTNVACPLFVPLVESGYFQEDKVDSIVQSSLQEIRSDKNIDTLILGCTHFPLLEDSIHRVLGKSIKLISPSKETARDLKLVLTETNLLNNQEKLARYTFITTGGLKNFKFLMDKILPSPLLENRQINIEQLSLTNIK